MAWMVFYYVFVYVVECSVKRFVTSSQAQHKRHFLTYLQSCPMATLVYSSKVTEEHSWKLIQLLPVLHSIHLLLLL